MPEAFGASFDCDQTAEMHRQSIFARAERLEVFARCIAMMMTTRADDGAKGVRDSFAAEFAAMNEDFRALGRTLLNLREERAKKHFAVVGTKEHQAQEQRRQELLQEEAEADAAQSG